MDFTKAGNIGCAWVRSTAEIFSEWISSVIFLQASLQTAAGLPRQSDQE